MADVHSERWGMSTVQLGWKRTKVETRGLPTCVYRTLERIQSRVWDENRWTADDTPVVHCALRAESAPSSPNTTPVKQSTCTAKQNGGTSQRGHWEARIFLALFVLFGIFGNSTKSKIIISPLAHVPAEVLSFSQSSDSMLYVSHDCGI